MRLFSISSFLIVSLVVSLVGWVVCLVGFFILSRHETELPLTFHFLVAVVNTLNTKTPVKKKLNSFSKLQMLNAFVIADSGRKANCHFL